MQYQLNKIKYCKQYEWWQTDQLRQFLLYCSILLPLPFFFLWHFSSMQTSVWNNSRWSLNSEPSRLPTISSKPSISSASCISVAVKKAKRAWPPVRPQVALCIPQNALLLCDSSSVRVASTPSRCFPLRVSRHFVEFRYVNLYYSPVIYTSSSQVISIWSAGTNLWPYTFSGIDHSGIGKGK